MMHWGERPPLEIFAGDPWCGSSVPVSLAPSLAPLGSSVEPLKPAPSSAQPPKQPRGKASNRRALGDLSNIAGLQGLSGGVLEKHSLGEPRTPAPGRSSSFTVFDDGMDLDGGATATRCPPPQQMSENSQSVLGSLQIPLPGPAPPVSLKTGLGAEELPASSLHGCDLPSVEDFAYPSDEQEQYDQAMSLDECEGFGNPAELASALLQSAQMQCTEADSFQQHALANPWDSVFANSPAISLLEAPSWQAFLSPARAESDSFRFSPLSIPDLPCVQMDMSDDEFNGESGDSERRRLF